MPNFISIFPISLAKNMQSVVWTIYLVAIPASSISFVSGVGVNSKKVTYGNNRGDFTFIPGGMVPGNYLIKPDFYENKEDWPFIWYENEVVVDGCAGYIYLSALIDNILQKEEGK
jgi:endoglucanase